MVVLLLRESETERETKRTNYTRSDRERKWGREIKKYKRSWFPKQDQQRNPPILSIDHMKAIDKIEFPFPLEIFSVQLSRTRLSCIPTLVSAPPTHEAVTKKLKSNQPGEGPFLVPRLFVDEDGSERNKMAASQSDTFDLEPPRPEARRFSFIRSKRQPRESRSWPV